MWNVKIHHGEHVKYAHYKDAIFWIKRFVKHSRYSIWWEPSKDRGEDCRYKAERVVGANGRVHYTNIQRP